ncbi:MAG: hypothetical protein M1828_000340 [Chrysothrix sp. TS-e1954]|nr:MAG: hypothetical protein M1828_000340 [Chrysothrix sp. TS-e1954]
MEDDPSADNPALTQPAIHTLSHTSRQRSSNTTAKHPPDETASSNDDSNSSPSTFPSKYDKGWRRIVRNFSPSWFTPTMGTGVVAVLLQTIPFQPQNHWLHYLSLAFYALNVVLFALAFSISLLRYTLYPEIWGVMIRDPTNSLFLSTVPMGFATLIEMWVYVCVPAWGSWAITFAWVAWMVDAVVAASTTVFLCFVLISASHQTSLSSITALQLLPIAATIVAAGLGSLVSGVLENPQHALGTILTCYVMWGVGVPMALVVLVMYYQRLAVHKLPPREVIVSCFLPLGPLGFGGFTIMYLGKTSLTIFPQTSTLHPLAGPILYVTGYLAALLLWGFGLIWLIFATASIVKITPRFSMGFWGFTFPLGVYAASTIQLGRETPSRFFRVLGTVFACCVVVLWAVCAAGTVRGVWSGKLFYAPCLKALRRENVEKGRVR